MRRLVEIDRRIRAGEFPHPNQLATDLEVARRVIFNDRAYLLDVLHAPLAFHKERRGWYYTEPTYALPTVSMTRPELLALVLAVEAAQRQWGRVVEKELLLAVEKIGQSLPEGHISVDLDALRRHLTFAPPPSAPIHPSHFDLFQQAVESQKVVAMNYFSAYRGHSSYRKVEPHHVVHSNGDWYLWAFDRTKEKMLTFNIARVENPEILPQTFARQEDFSPGDFLQNGFRTESGPDLYDVAVRFNAAQAPYIRERDFHATQRREELPNGELVLHFRASGLGELTRWVLQYGPRAQVLSPPELKAAVAVQAQELMRLYQTETACTDS